MTDIVDRLRQRAIALRSVSRQTATTKYDAELSDEAAAEIERLRRSWDKEVKLRQSMAKILSEQAARPIGIRPGKRRAIRRTGEPE